MMSRLPSPRRCGLATLLLLLPAFASAAEGQGVSLRFEGGERPWIYGALLVGFLSLGYGFLVARWVLAQNAGSEAMRRVGLAIKEGAQAYLARQIKTMVLFVLPLGAGLYGLYLSSGPQVASLIVLAFFAGVLASYVAGYTGMTIAVAGNMRTAHAAESSYKRALEVAFRSGSVAGLVTVGVGLVGASTILLLFPAFAPTLLVGFGFGGSLAALFMRVGGGIFTKAADVGADLVGKVEAGIPEDDPRNPAVIADNVGDNVGDCAGMAADVFESYAVTLVAAIVLGAATAAIFDAAIWIKLVLFALVCKAVGIVASIIGMAAVRGSDDLDADPLKAIRKGFYVSAAFVVLGTAGVAFLLMKEVRTTQLKTKEQFAYQERSLYGQVRDEIAARTKTSAYAVTASEVLKDPRISAKDFGPNPTEALGRILAEPIGPAPNAPAGYARVTAADANAPTSEALRRALNYATENTARTPGASPFTTVSARFAPANADDRYVAVRLSFDLFTPAVKDPKGGVVTPETKIKRELWVGPVRRKAFLDELTAQKTQVVAQKGTFDYRILDERPADLFYSAKEDAFLLGVGGVTDAARDLNPNEQLGFYRATVADLTRIAEQYRTAPATSRPGVPPRQTIGVAVAESREVAWWMFLLPVAFGVLMALVIETITNYYVGTKHRPTREVAGVSSAGAAPMIIQGFALAAESSVFMVLAIVFALLVPLYIFPAAIFGTTILAFYGAALVGLGLLSTTGFVLAMDTFGPISDNAQGVYEMSGAAEENPRGAIAVARLDAAGNTTKALTKGFAIATAVIAAVALFHSFVESANLQAIGLRLDVPEIFLGLLIGGAAPYLFSAFAINAVGRAAFQLINEVRRQFRADAGILAGTSKPDYGRCVAIVTAAAQRELLSPGILAIFLPMAVAFGFSIGKAPTIIGGQPYNLAGAQALGGFLAGAIVSGQLMAVLLSNSGGMWDNAKKLIEDGLHGGKGTEAHKAAVVCDTVGDPFKDTAGPALNPLIKVMNLVALLLVGVVIRPLSNTTLVIVTAGCVAALGVAVFMSKRGSLAEAMATDVVPPAPQAVVERADAGALRIVAGDAEEHPIADPDRD